MTTTTSVKKATTTTATITSSFTRNKSVEIKVKHGNDQNAGQVDFDTDISTAVQCE